MRGLCLSWFASSQLIGSCLYLTQVNSEQSDAEADPSIEEDAATREDSSDDDTADDARYFDARELQRPSLTLSEDLDAAGIAADGQLGRCACLQRIARCCCIWMKSLKFFAPKSLSSSPVVTRSLGGPRARPATVTLRQPDSLLCTAREAKARVDCMDCCNVQQHPLSGQERSTRVAVTVRSAEEHTN